MIFLRDWLERFSLDVRKRQYFLLKNIWKQKFYFLYSVFCCSVGFGASFHLRLSFANFFISSYVSPIVRSWNVWILFLPTVHPSKTVSKRPRASVYRTWSFSSVLSAEVDFFHSVFFHFSLTLSRTHQLHWRQLNLTLSYVCLNVRLTKIALHHHIQRLTNN